MFIQGRLKKAIDEELKKLESKFQEHADKQLDKQRKEKGVDESLTRDLIKKGVVAEMNRSDLKKLVKKLLNENQYSELGMPNYRTTGQGHHMGDEPPNDIHEEYKSYLVSFDSDPGFDTAVKFGKCLVSNKEIMREVLEIISQMEELKAEFEDKLRQMK